MQPWPDSGYLSQIGNQDCALQVATATGRWVHYQSHTTIICAYIQLGVNQFQHFMDMADTLKFMGMELLQDLELKSDDKARSISKLLEIVAVYGT